MTWRDAAREASDDLIREITPRLYAIRDAVQRHNASVEGQRRLSVRDALERALGGRRPELAHGLARYAARLDHPPPPSPSRRASSGATAYSIRIPCGPDRLIVRQRGQVLRHETDPTRWLVKAYVGRDGNGQKHYKSPTVRGTQRDAEMVLANLLGSKSEDRYEPIGAMTFAAFVDRHWWPEVEPTIKPRTRDGYASYLDRHVLPVYGRRSLDGLSEQDVRKLDRVLRHKGTPPTARAQAVAIFARIVKRAAERGNIALPLASIRRSPRRIRRGDP